MDGDAGRRLAHRDVVFALVVIAFCGIVYWQTLKLPPPRYEPLGPAAVPQALSAIVAVLAAGVLVRRVMTPGRRGEGPGDTAVAGPGFTPRPAMAAGALALTTSYVGAMDLGILGFVEASVLFLTLTGLFLGRRDWRRLPVLVGAALAVSLGSHFVFTRVFYIDLPTGLW